MMSRLSSVVKRHPIVTFFVLTYAISWGFLPIEAVRFMAGGPLIAALIVIPVTQGWAGLRGARLPDDPLARQVVLVRGGHRTPACRPPGSPWCSTSRLGAGAPSLAQFGSVTTFLMVFAVRLINPGDGPLGEEPGWRGFALPGLQTTLSPLVSTLILGVLVAGWHVPILFLEEGGLRPSVLVGGLLGLSR